MIDCNSIIPEAQALQVKFHKCKTLSAFDMRKIAELIISLKNCLESSSGETDNFVRVLSILSTDLSGTGTIEEQICEYILSLPIEERTIQETDSKWNIEVIIEEGVFIAKYPFILSTLEVIDACNNIGMFKEQPIDRLAYFADPDGIGGYPEFGDICYEDEAGTTLLENGVFTHNYQNTGNTSVQIFNGVISGISCL